MNQEGINMYYVTIQGLSGAHLLTAKNALKFALELTRCLNRTVRILRSTDFEQIFVRDPNPREPKEED
jgi:hypothetical protein